MIRFVVIFNLFTLTAFAQSNVYTVEPIGESSIDSRGSIFLTDRQGDVFRWNPESNDVLLYAPPKPSRITILDASNPLRIFAFYEDLQEFVYLDRFLTETGRYSLQEFNVYAAICAPSQNNRIWAVDLREFSLKKIDPLRSVVEINIPLNTILNPETSRMSHIQEYQNLLVISDENSGIYIFDNFGTHLSTLEMTDVTHFSFSENHLLAVAADKGILYDLYSSELTQFDLPAEVKQVLQYKNKRYFLTPDQIEVSEF